MSPLNLFRVKEFAWEKAVLSNWRWSIVLPAIYVVVIFVLKHLARNLPPLKLRMVTFYHNAFLALLSLCMGLGLLAGELDFKNAVGFWSTLLWQLPEGLTPQEALHQPYTATMVFWAYVFFLSKFYEFLDTAIIIFKKGKALTFLHMYHHSSMPLMTLAWFLFSWTSMWFPCIMNCTVHTLMYTYYAASSLGYRSRLRRYLTRIQIIQFVLGWLHSTWWIWTKYHKERLCGDFPELAPTYFNNIIFLGLFIDFYVEEYRTKERLKRESAAAGAAKKSDD